ncbi:MAG: hypothetical protein P4L49_17845 [Desulfosporosinus sp.]|nr:hypothetical protein [Desulfosporosinus sp.]
MSSRIVTKYFGGNGGGQFPEHVNIKTIGINCGAFIDQIRINGHVYGGDGGSKMEDITLSSGDYISNLEIRCGQFIDNLKFTFNNKVTYGGGGGGGSPITLNKIRVISIAGRAGQYVDQLAIKYVENYEPSSIIDKNAKFILNFFAPDTQTIEYKETEKRTLDFYQLVTEKMMETKMSSSVEAEYGAKISASLEIGFKDTETKTISSTIEDILKKSETMTTTVDDNHIAIQLMSGTLMQGDDGSYWVMPGDPQTFKTITIKLTDLYSVNNCYDMTQTLALQMTGISKYKTTNYGFDYYTGIPS